MPRDAEIPLDTEVLYDECGTKVSVKEFLSGTSVENRRTEWTIKAAYEGNFYYNSFKPKNMHLTRPDTWKRLLEDLSEQVTRGITRLAPTSTETKTKVAVYRAQVARTAALELPCATSHHASAS